MTNNPEQLNNERESSPESQAAAERLEQLDTAQENGSERSVESNETSVEKKSIEARELALSIEAGGKEKAPTPSNQSPALRRGKISKAQENASYKRTMNHVQSELSPGSRAFSKIIHNKVIEKTSEIVGSTIARPNAVLAGAVSAFILTLAVYVLAKNLGYKLSGFETIAAFIAGWVLGIVYDYLRVLITGKKS